MTPDHLSAGRDDFQSTVTRAQATKLAEILNTRWLERPRTVQPQQYIDRDEINVITAPPGTGFRDYDPLPRL